MSNITVAYLGPEHTYSHLAAQQLPTASDLLRGYETIDQVFVAIETGEVDCGVVPIFNSCSGLVSDSLIAILRRLLAHDPPTVERPAVLRAPTTLRPLRQLCVSHAFPLSIQHCLVSWGRLPDIRLVSSKQQALEQCRRWLGRHLPAADLQATESSAAALAELAGNPTHAAIVSWAAAQKLGAPLLISSIQDQRENTTEFVVVQADAALKPVLDSGGPRPAAARRPTRQPSSTAGVAQRHDPTADSGQLLSDGRPFYEYWLVEGASPRQVLPVDSDSQWVWSETRHFGSRLFGLGKRGSNQCLDGNAAWTLEGHWGAPPIATGRAWRLGGSHQ